MPFSEDLDLLDAVVTLFFVNNCLNFVVAAILSL